MPTTKLLETLADIAYMAGCHHYYSGDSRADIADFIQWANEFERLHRHTDWADEDYMLAVEKFAMGKIGMELQEGSMEEWNCPSNHASAIAKNY